MFLEKKKLELSGFLELLNETVKEGGGFWILFSSKPRITQTWDQCGLEAAAGFICLWWWKKSIYQVFTRRRFLLSDALISNKTSCITDYKAITLDAFLALAGNIFLHVNFLPNVKLPGMSPTCFPTQGNSSKDLFVDAVVISVLFGAIWGILRHSGGNIRDVSLFL